MTNNLLSQSPASADRQELVAKLTRAYQADQQVKYLHLQAEIEVLLQQLQQSQTVKASK
jgi:hypothetical protein